MLRFPWSGKRNTDVSSRPDQLSVDRYCFNVRAGLGKGSRNDRARLKCDHFARLPICKIADRTSAEIRSKHSVKCIWATASLQMAKNHTSRFFSGDLFDRSPHVLADTTKP